MSSDFGRHRPVGEDPEAGTVLPSAGNPPEAGQRPTFWQVARRPRYVVGLIVALAIAATFALLGQWQLERSIDTSRVVGPDTETPVPLADIARPQMGVAGEVAWRRVVVDVRIVPGDTIVLSGRVNTDSAGWWVVAHAVDTAGASLAVAAGWAPDEAAALDAAAALERAGDLGAVTGRYLPPESPQQSDFEAGERSALSPAELVNVWTGVGDVYGGYLVLDEPGAGLVGIDAPAPDREVEVNLLNLFYALEWVLFAGAAAFIWWRVVKDALDRERDAERAHEAHGPDA